jgi:hypothetical protein
MAINQPQCGGICILTDLGTYNNFIKPFTNFNNVLYSLHGWCVGKTRNIITGWSNQPQRGGGGGTNCGGICILRDLGIYNNFIKPWLSVNNVFHPWHDWFSNKTRNIITRQRLNDYSGAAAYVSQRIWVFTIILLSPDSVWIMCFIHGMTDC